MTRRAFTQAYRRVRLWIRRHGTAWEHPGSRKRKGQPVCPGAGKPIANASPPAAR